MTSLVITIPIVLVMGLISLATFFWALRRDQFEDLDGAANRILIDDEDEVGDKAEPDDGQDRI